MKIYRTVLNLGVFTAMVFGGAACHAQGIPVYDNVNTVNVITNQMKNIQQYVAQYNAMVQQYNQQLAQFKSITGIRNFHDLMNNPEMRQYLPQDWAQMTNVAMQLSNCADFKEPGALARCSGDAKYAADAAISQRVQASIAQRKKDIQSLINQLGRANDAKDTADLTARIAGEQANLAAEQAELAAYERNSAMQAANNEAAVVDKLLLRSAATLENPFTKMPTSAKAAGN